jgi:hypothetical protein
MVGTRHQVADEAAVDDVDDIGGEGQLDRPPRRLAGADVESAVVLGALDRPAVQHDAV